MNILRYATEDSSLLLFLFIYFFVRNELLSQYINSIFKMEFLASTVATVNLPSENMSVQKPHNLTFLVLLGFNFFIFNETE